MIADDGHILGTDDSIVTVRVVPEDETPFEAPVVGLITDTSRYDEADRTMSGFVIFKAI